MNEDSLSSRRRVFFAFEYADNFWNLQILPNFLPFWRYFRQPPSLNLVLFSRIDISFIFPYFWISIYPQLYIIKDEKTHPYPSFSHLFSHCPLPNWGIWPTGQPGPRKMFSRTQSLLDRVQMCMSCWVLLKKWNMHSIGNSCQRLSISTCLVHLQDFKTVQHHWVQPTEWRTSIITMCVPRRIFQKFNRPMSSDSGVPC